MGIQFDIIIPPVIAGFIILTLYSINSFMMETSVDNRVIHEMQTFADNTAILIKNELRYLDTIESISDHSIRFVNTEKDTIEIYRQDRKLYIKRITTTTNIDEHASRLNSLTFTPKKTNNEEALSIANTAIIHFQVVTESLPEQHVGKENKRIQAYAEKQIYLRNVFYQ